MPLREEIENRSKPTLVGLSESLGLMNRQERLRHTEHFLCGKRHSEQACCSCMRANFHVISWLRGTLASQTISQLARALVNAASLARFHMQVAHANRHMQVFTCKRILILLSALHPLLPSSSSASKARQHSQHIQHQAEPPSIWPQPESTSSRCAKPPTRPTRSF